MKIHLQRHHTIDYPSASALEYYNGELYVIGDDVNYILKLDPAWNVSSEITLFSYNGARIPKPDKPDLESAAVIDDMLYLLGSGSRSPQRDIAFLVQLSDSTVKKINTVSFYSLFRDKGLIAEMNIEGFTLCGDKLLFFNRGNTIQPNQVIVSDRQILKRQFPNRFKIMSVETGVLKNINLGISGACYDAENDLLLLTASAEDTNNAYDDGAILGSVLGVIEKAYSKLDNQKLSIDHFIELDLADAVFADQKIESICIVKNESNKYTCVLAADNDDGKSTLFEVIIEL